MAKQTQNNNIRYHGTNGLYHRCFYLNGYAHTRLEAGHVNVTGVDTQLLYGGTWDIVHADRIVRGGFTEKDIMYIFWKLFQYIVKIK